LAPGVRKRCVTVPDTDRIGYPAVPPSGVNGSCPEFKIRLGGVMRLPKQVANATLGALIEGGGFRSLERFALAVNVRGWDMQGLKLAYDHVTVKRWLTGSVCQNPDVVAAVLSDAWGVPVPVQVIWPELRDGATPVPAHLQPWV